MFWSDFNYLKTKKGKSKPAKNLNKTTFKTASGSRRILSKIRTTLRQSKYRKDLKTAALRRASALLNGQKAAPAAEKKAAKKAETK